MTSPNHGPTPISIDRTGNYGGQMYVATGSQDRITTVSTTGTVSLYVNWPGWIDGGAPGGLAFDLLGKYDNKMYIATSYPATSSVSGLFKMNPDTSVSRFSDELVSAHVVGFDTIGTYFDGDMFVIGTTNFGISNSL